MRTARKEAPASWTVDSWRSLPVAQCVAYPDDRARAAAVAELAQLPPLVTSWEIETLRSELAKAARGEAFLLQAGDCAERFDECRADIISAKLKIILQMGLVLSHGLRQPVVRVGRWAGQYCKPRSQPTETRGDVTLPAYRGDAINQLTFTAAARAPDPQRLVMAHGRAAQTLNFVRALVSHGFADLQSASNWDLSFAAGTPQQAEFARVVDSVRESLRIVAAATGGSVSAERATVFTSHEGLSLDYESALTRTVPRRDGCYDLSTHFPWIGMRSAVPEGAHVEFFSGLRNPLGLKVGPTTAPADVVKILARLDPAREAGRMTIIHRLGADLAAQLLPPLVAAVRAGGWRPLWVCDPMHGNTEYLPSGYKTRNFDRILAEVERSALAHRAAGSHLGGIHVEITGEDVTECTGGARGLAMADLERAYRSAVDPRLNVEQSLELAFRIARSLAGAC